MILQRLATATQVLQVGKNHLVSDMMRLVEQAGAILAEIETEQS